MGEVPRNGDEEHRKEVVSFASSGKIIYICDFTAKRVVASPQNGRSLI